MEIEKSINATLFEINEDEKIESINLGFQCRGSSVVKLSLRNQNLTQFPKQIRQLKNLEYLNLGKNLISEVPEWINELKKLKILIFSDNQIKQLPRNIGKMESLEVLHILQNPIEKLPMTFRRYADIYSQFRELAIRKYGLNMNTIETIELLKNRGVRIIESK